MAAQKGLGEQVEAASLRLLERNRNLLLNTGLHSLLLFLQGCFASFFFNYFFFLTIENENQE